MGAPKGRTSPWRRRSLGEGLRYRLVNRSLANPFNNTHLGIANMADDIPELIDFAEELLSSLPNSPLGSSATEWMTKARDFASACMHGEELKPELAAVISVRERGELRRAVISIRTAGQQFQGALTALEATNSLTLVITKLNKIPLGSRHKFSWMNADPDEVDDLLPLASRKAFDEDIAVAILECSPTRPLALLMMDIDHFKKVNDSHGHQVGDEVLIAAANVVHNSIDGKGKGYRYGGEELTVLLPNTTVLEAISSAERIRASIEALAFSKTGLQVTISIGVAGCENTTMTSAQLVGETDKLLYEAKEKGRNKVIPRFGWSGIPSTANSAEKRPKSSDFSHQTRPTWSPSVFWDINNAFAKIPKGDGSDIAININDGEHIFLRLVPSVSIDPINPTDALKLVQQGGLIPMTDSLFGLHADRNRHGAFVYAHVDGPIHHVTELLKNGELWGIDAYSINKKFRMESANVNFGYFPCSYFELVFKLALTNYLTFTKNTLRISPPLKLIAGATRVEGYKMSLPSSHFHTPFGGNVVEQNIVYSAIIQTYEQKPFDILLPFFEYVWRECGLERPKLEVLD